MNTPDLVKRLRSAVRRDRLLDTAQGLVAVPSRTGEAGTALDTLAELLRRDGFTVERPTGGYPQAPAVAVRYPSSPDASPRTSAVKPAGLADSSRGLWGRTIQFNGHMDTVHLPFVPPRVDGGR